MIRHLFLILCYQLAGEAISQGLGLPLPGPVLGMALLTASFLAMPRLYTRIEGTARGVLAHLSLLFVPVGVGVIRYLDLLQREGLAIALVLLASTALAIAAAALVFVWVLRLTGGQEQLR
ncbi:CidA/LrgA family protein [Pseudoroseicyclus aestuarii]|uniref:Putative effector of murein hydrolase LrgA (UPF0299 family) n=1 Tax=Pseudoroseicyclus aestuarii TaxID=1795041 RepID=A0A318SX39_9RHOB|nr:CidA/LrgA family protein [Pseudoroseicyclus aestuarii]PYE84909.1 putative effector of murein hydrolase LrgA (UPF0299 family) [Pseudoroseicyclus aestuarii]